jgi:hypothetical protein
VAELGRVDIVLPNAGIAQLGGPEPDAHRTWDEVIGVDLTGVWNTVHVAAPRMIEQGDGGAIALTSSTQGLTGRGGDGSRATSGYAAAKHGVVGLMRPFSYWLAPHNIRVNSVHPTAVATPMVMNDVIGKWIAANPEAANTLANLMPLEIIKAVDISNAMAFLVSDVAGTSPGRRCRSTPASPPDDRLPGGRCAAGCPGPGTSPRGPQEPDGEDAMAGRVAGKVAFTTGAARSQGRSPASCRSRSVGGSRPAAGPGGRRHHRR